MLCTVAPLVIPKQPLNCQSMDTGPFSGIFRVWHRDIGSISFGSCGTGAWGLCGWGLFFYDSQSLDWIGIRGVRVNGFSMFIKLGLNRFYVAVKHIFVLAEVAGV